MLSRLSTPFTYLVGWTKQNLFYYGRRTSVNCHPTQLWKSYFTSSKYVTRARELYGEPDLIQVRRTFTDVEKCTLWEDKVIRRLKLSADVRFLNKSCNTSAMSTTGFGVARHAASGVHLGIISLDDPRWKTGEIVGHTKGTARAKTREGIPLGLVPQSDLRWKTGEIVGIQKGRSTTPEQKIFLKQSRLKVCRIQDQRLLTTRDFNSWCEQMDDPPYRQERALCCRLTDRAVVPASKVFCNVCRIKDKKLMKLTDFNRWAKFKCNQ